MISFRRHGDVNLFPVTKAQYESITGKKIKHKGKYVLAEGEATNSEHVISVIDPKQMEIKEDDLKRVWIALKNEATVTHTHDHETITTPAKKTYYVQIPEREIDHFADNVERKVVD
jgi:16S rRNA U516 pseudouridylate synthase RsuA-like enzyme